MKKVLLLMLIFVLVAGSFAVYASDCDGGVCPIPVDDDCDGGTCPIPVPDDTDSGDCDGGVCPLPNGK